VYLDGASPEFDRVVAVEMVLYLVRWGFEIPDPPANDNFVACVSNVISRWVNGHPVAVGGRRGAVLALGDFHDLVADANGVADADLAPVLVRGAHFVRGLFQEACQSDGVGVDLERPDGLGQALPGIVGAVAVGVEVPLGSRNERVAVGADALGAVCAAVVAVADAHVVLAAEAMAGARVGALGIDLRDRRNAQKGGEEEDVSHCG
jgi:hypothetical protein